MAVLQDFCLEFSLRSRVLGAENAPAVELPVLREQTGMKVKHWIAWEMTLVI